MTQTYLYKDYIKRLSERFEAGLTEILAGYNFDYGDEFEIALCKILRTALPTKYGICRGHVVDAEGNMVGDDIIIYEQIRFPTLGMREKDDYARKEFIPIEAVYCYIEAKHTLNLKGDDNQSFAKACEQVRKIKERCSKREDIPIGRISPYINLKNADIELPEHFPKIRNPVFCVIFSHNIRLQNGSKLLEDITESKAAISGMEILGDKTYHPDLIVMGKNIIATCTIEDKKIQIIKTFLYSPYQNRNLVHM